MSIFEPHEQAAWRRPPKVTIDQWAEAHIVIPYGAERGPLSLDRTPFAREILRMVSDPFVEEITLMFAAQVCKTLICQLICLYYMAEEREACLHVMPKKDDAVSINCDRYQEIIKASPRLKGLLTGAAHDMTRDAIRFTNGGIIHFASAQSPSDLASRPIRILILDETDKYTEFSGREANPISLARERTTTYANRKIIKASTPLTDQGYILNEYMAGDQRQHFVPCPHCGTFQTLVPERLKRPEDENDPERIIDARATWYECEACKGRIEDKDKRRVMREAKWVPSGAKITPSGQILDAPRSKRRLSYRLSRLYSLWENASFSHVAAEKVRSEATQDLLMNYLNSWLAEVYENKIEELKAPHVRARIGNYPIGTRPAGAKVLTAGVDVQQRSIWYVLRGWGTYGESWLIRVGSVDSWEQLALVLALNPHNPQPYGAPRAVFIDSRYRDRRDEVYAFCRFTGCQAIIGSGGANPMRHYWQLGKVKMEDGHELSRLSLDTTHFKEKLHRKIHRGDADPGAWHLPGIRTERGVTDGCPPWYFEHMVAEQRVIEKHAATLKSRIAWKLNHAHARNEAFDCEVYALAAACFLGIEDVTGNPVERHVETDDEPPGTKPPEPPPKPPKPRPMVHVRSQIFS